MTKPYDDSTFDGYVANSLQAIPNRLEVGGLRIPTRTLGVAGGLASAIIFGALMRGKLDKLKKAKPAEARKVFNYFKLKNMPLLPYENLENAAYIDAGHFQPGLFSRGIHEEDDVLQRAVLKNPKLLDKMRQHGAVIYDKKFNVPAVLAHEAGHADIGNMPWYAPSKINQNYGRATAGLTNFAAPFAGILTGALTRNPFLGLGAGALTGAVLNAPTLVNEWQATNRANKYLDEKMLDPEEKKKSRGALGSAFNTYLAQAAVPAALMGGMAGYLSNDASSRDLFGRLKATGTYF